ncbi:MAG TPA: TIGR03118 family protein [Actinomycetota bacterium]|nr:TIGR03118 family protein [Actinomycetota bacterium]
MRKRSVVLVCVVALVALGAALTPAAASGNSYKLTRLVSDRAGAQHRDPNLVNAWGLVAGPTTPWWVANNHSNTSTLYDGSGTPLPLVVTVGGAPTGTVFNGGKGFVVSHNGESGPALFLFDTESGVIRGWNPDVPSPAPSTKAFRVVDMRSDNAIFKGLAIAHTDHHGDRLYATDFHNAKVDVFDEQFNPVNIKGAFQDPNIPDGYAPFGIQTIGHHIFVTYAKQDADAEDDVAGAGLGFVDMYGRSGKLLQRVASRGSLDAPWGIAWAPRNFGAASGDLLIGNFGDGVINIFEPESHGQFEHQGSLHRRNGNQMVIPGLWALEFGNNGPAGPSTTLFFTAGPNDETHGLFGSIEAQS